MIETPTESELERVRKFPWQWALIILLSAVASLFGIIIYNNRDQIKGLSAALVRKDSIINDWQAKYINLSTELLYKNNIIDRQNRVIMKTDSTARKKLEKPAKQIVKNNE